VKIRQSKPNFQYGKEDRDREKEKYMAKMIIAFHNFANAPKIE